jgi:hypothetical protein
VALPQAARRVAAVLASVAFLALAACERTGGRGRDDAVIEAAIEKARQEQLEADRAAHERVIAGELARREAEQAEIDARMREEQAREATTARLEERLRNVLVDPASMQIRNPHLSADGTTLCAEVNARNRQGVYLGFRRAVVSDTVISMDQDPDDLYREPQHRFAEVARATGCY